MTANALMQGSYIIALIIGSTLAGYLTALLGTGFAIVFDAATFFASAGAIAVMVIPPLAAALNGERPTPAELWREVKAGLRFIRSRQAWLLANFEFDIKDGTAKIESIDQPQRRGGYIE